MAEVDGTRWAGLFHAYGRAVDTPGHLRALTDGDEAARQAAMYHLWAAIIHQGTPWTATGLVAETVGELLGDPRLAGADLAPLRAELLRFLAEVGRAGALPSSEADYAAMARVNRADFDAEVAAAFARLVAEVRADENDEDDDEDDDREGTGDAECEELAYEALFEDEELADAICTRAFLGCVLAAPKLLGLVMACLADTDPRVRASAADAAVKLLAAGRAVPEVGGDGPASVPAGVTEELGARLRFLAARAEPDERAALVLAAGELGVDTAEYLTGRHPGVRACAALAPAFAASDDAATEILAALADPAGVEAWFVERPPQFPGRTTATLVAAAIDRVDDFERLLPAALAIARDATLSTVDDDWGPLLLAAFGDGRVGSSRLTAPQHAYLTALVDNPDLWDPINGNAGRVFQRAGLVYDRQACQVLVERDTTS